MQNAGMRLATVTPIGAFPLIDYLIATSQDVGEGLTRLARYQRLAEARSVPCLLGDEDPIRVLLEGFDTPVSAEFTVTLNLLHFREETEGRLRAAYASFRHTPDDIAEMEQCSVVRCARERRGTGGRCLATCLNFRSADATPPWAVCSSDRPTRQSRGFHPWRVLLWMCAEHWRRASEAATRA